MNQPESRDQALLRALALHWRFGHSLPNTETPRMQQTPHAAKFLAWSVKTRSFDEGSLPSPSLAALPAYLASRMLFYS